MTRDLCLIALGGLASLLLVGANAITTQGNIETDGQLISTVERGTPPLSVQSSSLVSNLNADMLDDKDASAFALASSTYSKSEVDALLAGVHRRFYLTPTYHKGGPDIEVGPLAACAAGYHMASLWEILDLTALRYNHDLGFVWSDAPGMDGDEGEGPVANVRGWVRTGYWALPGLIAGPGTSGHSNCVGWTTVSASESGSSVALNSCWEQEGACLESLGDPTGAPTLIAPWWRAEASPCDDSLQVWCVED